MIVRIVHPDQLQRFIPELTRLFEDFLRRAKEPFPIEALWAALLRGLAQGESFLFLVAFDQKVHPAGYLLAQSGYDWWGVVKYANVIQAYIVPGAKGVDKPLYERFEEWADAQGAQVLSALTQRDSKGYARWMKRWGFERGPVTYLKIKEQPSGKTIQDHA